MPNNPFVESKIAEFEKEFPHITDELITAKSDKDEKSAEILTVFMRREASRIKLFFRQALLDQQEAIAREVVRICLSKKKENELTEKWSDDYLIALDEVRSAITSKYLNK